MPKPPSRSLNEQYCGKPAITGYDVRHSEADFNNWTTVRVDDAASTTLIIGGLRALNYYDFQVLALNADGAGPWSSTAEGITSPLPEKVLANHPLIPVDLGPGDSFRLLFITGDTNDVYKLLTAATGTSLPDYHDFASLPTLHIVEPGHFLRSWGEAKLWQTALVSLAGADARLVTDTTWTGTDRGVPIYWLNGARVADDYADFYDGAWADEANPRDGLGRPYPLDGPALWTGTDHDGTASRAMGQATVGVGGLGSSAVGAGPLNGRVGFASTEERPLYGLWHVMVVDENLRLLDNFHVPRVREDEGLDTRAAVRAQLFTTGPNSTGYGIDSIYVSAGPDDDFLGPVALYTTDANGKPDLVDGLHATLSLETDTYWSLSAPVGTVLNPNTTYALVFQGNAGSYPELGLPLPQNLSLDFMQPLRYGGRHGDSESGLTYSTGQPRPPARRAGRGGFAGWAASVRSPIASVKRSISATGGAGGSARAAAGRCPTCRRPPATSRCLRVRRLAALGAGRGCFRTRWRRRWTCRARSARLWV